MSMSLVKKTGSLSADAAQWLEARGLDSALCEERLGLTSFVAKDGHEWLTLPFERNGVQVNRKFRRIDTKEWRQDKGGEQIFWRVDCLADAGLADEPLVITEGEFDAIAAIQAGFWRTVSVPSGAPTEKAEDARSAAKYTFIEQALQLLQPIKQIVIASDADGPGAALLADLTTLLNPARCKFVIYPPGCKDLNDVLRQHGADGVKACINGARWVSVAGVYKLSELPPAPPLRVYRPNVLPAIDKLIPICLGHVSIWTGLAGDGKSTLLNACMWSIADREHKRIAHAAFESTPQREYIEDLVAFRSGRAVGDWAEAATSEDVANAKAWAEDHIVFLVSDGFSQNGEGEWIEATIDWFIQAATTAIVRHGCEIVILDPWSQIDHDWGGTREDEYVRRSLKRLKSLARVFNVHVAIVAHPAKPRKEADGTYEVPDGYSVSGAAHWKNAPELGITVYRDPPWVQDPEGEEGDLILDPHSTRTLVRVWKVKFHRQLNKPGDAYAAVDCRTGRYYSPEHWEEITHRRSTSSAQRQEWRDD